MGNPAKSGMKIYQFFIRDTLKKQNKKKILKNFRKEFD